MRYDDTDLSNAYDEGYYAGREAALRDLSGRITAARARHAEAMAVTEEARAVLAELAVARAKRGAQ